MRGTGHIPVVAQLLSCIFFSFFPLWAWRTNGTSFPVWALAARVAFAISPSSAACERVFALLKEMFTEEQQRTLSDILEATLMLNYNGRRVG